MQVTYPLDTLRLRIAVDPSMRGIRGASTALFREGSYNAFFRGLTASLIGTVLESLPAWLVLFFLLEEKAGCYRIDIYAMAHTDAFPVPYRCLAGFFTPYAAFCMFSCHVDLQGRRERHLHHYHMHALNSWQSMQI